MFCSKCGNAAVADQNFCPNCGKRTQAPLPPRQSQSTPKPKEKEITDILIVIGVLAAMGALVLLAQAANQKDVATLFGGLQASLGLFGVPLFFYFFPTIVVVCRSLRGRTHKNGFSIFMTNLFLGWTVIGWIVALIWAFSDGGSSAVPVVMMNDSGSAR